MERWYHEIVKGRSGWDRKVEYLYEMKRGCLQSFCRGNRGMEGRKGLWEVLEAVGERTNVLMIISGM